MSGPQRPRARIRLALASVTAGLVLASAIPFTSASAAEPPASMLLQWDAYANAAIFSLPSATPAGAGQTPPVRSSPPAAGVEGAAARGCRSDPAGRLDPPGDGGDGGL